MSNDRCSIASDSTALPHSCFRRPLSQAGSKYPPSTPAESLVASGWRKSVVKCGKAPYRRWGGQYRSGIKIRPALKTTRTPSRLVINCLPFQNLYSYARTCVRCNNLGPVSLTPPLFASPRRASPPCLSALSQRSDQAHASLPWSATSRTQASFTA
ncbi:hypothetical protein EJ06DRAFT_264673 [Trichodelitschia bisporula]|uniref:Uncharacterized protein n=1 Tax=Trichodelitschia bisporula TaxID=703511 RepID=A0A6G1HIY8_9PEZI|nr:hypothetical protein EJ06DRAFT_264673 [Trichodelitschia bisporula]